MRLIGYRWRGTAHLGVAYPGRIAPLGPVRDCYADVPAMLAAAGSAEPTLRRSDVEPAAFVPDTAKIFCVGLNYRDHAAEAGRELPRAPDLFGRWASTLVADGELVPLPPAEGTLDWEGELAVIMGACARSVTADEARSAILGYACFNDLTARRHQQATAQWTLGKNADRSAPMGPALVTADDVTDPAALTLQTRVNGEVMQHASTGDLIFTPAEIIAYISGVATLHPGDVIATGTPSGVGYHRSPRLALRAGDTVEVEISGLGVLRNQVVAGI